MEDKRRRRISSYAGFFSLQVLSTLSGRDWIFPFYHAVSCSPPAHIRHLYRCRSEKEFTEDLELLLKHFEPAGPDDYLAGKKGPKPRMVLSFDDGLVECHQFIAPHLKQKGVPAIFFLNNDFVDNRGLFHRYKASMLIEHLKEDSCHVTRAAEFLSIPEEKVEDALLMINHLQKPLLDSLSLHLGFDEAAALKSHPIYMSDKQVRDLLNWGFDVGAHSADHKEFNLMETRKIAQEVNKSMTGTRELYPSSPACFAFPFTSDGVPAAVIDEILDESGVELLFGTAGLKKTHRREFVQRIPMESLNMPAGKVLRTEFLYYLMKAPLNRNHYRS